MTNRNIEKENQSQLYVIEPTLEQMLSVCENRKVASDLAGMEYSNFLKHCKNIDSIRIDTYLRCLNAFGYDLVLWHLPHGTIESIDGLNLSSANGSSLKIIDNRDLIYLLNNACEIDTRRVMEFLANVI